MKLYRGLALATIFCGGTAIATAQTLPSYMAPISGRVTSTDAETATKNVLALNTTMFELYGDAAKVFQANILAKHPVILGLFSGAGGRFTLYRPGQPPLEILVVACQPRLEPRVVRGVAVSHLQVHRRRSACPQQRGELRLWFLSYPECVAVHALTLCRLATQHTDSLMTICHSRAEAVRRACSPHDGQPGPRLPRTLLNTPRSPRDGRCTDSPTTPHSRQTS